MDIDEPVRENEINKYYQATSDCQNNNVPSDNVGEISSAVTTTMTTNSNINVSYCRENSVELYISTFSDFKGNFSKKTFMPLSKNYMVTSNLKEMKLLNIINSNSLPSINFSNISVFLRRKNSLIKDLIIKPIVSKQTPLVTFEQDDVVYIPVKDGCQSPYSDFSSRSQPYTGGFGNVPSVLTNIGQRNCTGYTLNSYDSNNNIFLPQGRQMNISSLKGNKFSVNFQRSLSTLRVISSGFVASINNSNYHLAVNEKKFENLISNLNLPRINQSNFKTGVMILRTGQNISQMELVSSMTSSTLYVNPRNSIIHEKYLCDVSCPISNDSLINTSLTDHSFPLNPCAENYFSSKTMKKFLTISKTNIYKLPFIHRKELNSVNNQLKRNNCSELSESLSLRLVSNSSNVHVQDSISVSMIRNLKMFKRSNFILFKTSVSLVMLPSNASGNTCSFLITPSDIEQLISCKGKPCLLQMLAENIFGDCSANLVCLDNTSPLNRSNFPWHLHKTTYDFIEGNQRCLNIRSLLISMMLFHINPQCSHSFPEYSGTKNINQIWKQVRIDLDLNIVLFKLTNNAKNIIPYGSQACITYPLRKSITSPSNQNSSTSNQNFESSNICTYLMKMEQNCQNILANIKQLQTSCNSEIIIKTDTETITLPVNHALLLIDGGVQSILGLMRNFIKALCDGNLNSQKMIKTKKLLPFQYRNLFQIAIALDDRSSDNKLVPNVSRDISFQGKLNSLVLCINNHNRQPKQFGLKYTDVSIIFSFVETNINKKQKLLFQLSQKETKYQR